MAATIGTLKARLLIEITPGRSIEVGTIEIPVEADGAAFRVASIDMRAALRDALHTAAQQLDESPPVA
jgi:hypothetical protein